MSRFSSRSFWWSGVPCLVAAGLALLGEGQGAAAASPIQQAIMILENRNEIAARVKAQADQRAAEMQAKAGGAVEGVQSNLNAQFVTKNSLTRLQIEAQEAKDRILGGQSPESAYALAKADFDEARSLLNEAQQRVLGSPDYKERRRAAQAESNAGEAVSRVHREALAADAQYQEALAEFNARKAVLAELASKLLKADPDFQETIVQMTQTAEQVAQSRQAFEDALFKRALAISNLNHAQSLAAEAGAIIAKNNAKIASLRGAEQSLARAARERRYQDRINSNSAGSRAN